MNILTDDNDIELETALQELMLNLLGNRVETDIRLSTNLLSVGHSVFYKRCWDGRRDVEEGKEETVGVDSRFERLRQIWMVQTDINRPLHLLSISKRVTRHYSDLCRFQIPSLLEAFRSSINSLE